MRAEAHEVTHKYVDVAVGDGTTLKAWLAQPGQAGYYPGVIVLQEAYGVNQYLRDVTDRLASDGYVAIAPELYHRIAPGFEGDYSNEAGVLPYAHALRDDSLELDLRASYEWLRAAIPSGAPVGAVGFCLGGRAAFLAALKLDIACSVSFYGAGITGHPNEPGLIDDAANLKCPMLLFWGGRDEHISHGQIDESLKGLRAAQADFIHVEISNAHHGFFCHARPSYSETATLVARPAMLAFLQLHLKSNGNQGSSGETCS